MRRLGVLAAALALVLALAASAAARGDKGEENEPLELYTVVVEPGEADDLAAQGLDVVSTQPAGDAVEADVVLTETEVAILEERGLQVDPKRNRDGLTQTQLFAALAAGGFAVGAPTTSPAGSATSSMRSRGQPAAGQARGARPDDQGREIIALKLTQGARGQARRLPARGALQLAPARPRVDHRRGQPADA